MKPNLQIAPDSECERVEIYFDMASKVYGIRKIQTVIKNEVYVSTEKCMEMTLNQLERLIKDAQHFVGKFYYAMLYLTYPER
jgi:hypothetical protein